LLNSPTCNFQVKKLTNENLSISFTSRSCRRHRKSIAAQVFGGFIKSEARRLHKLTARTAKTPHNHVINSSLRPALIQLRFFWQIGRKRHMSMKLLSPSLSRKKLPCLTFCYSFFFFPFGSFSAAAAALLGIIALNMRCQSQNTKKE
jgi:hypothetical protein